MKAFNLMRDPRQAREHLVPSPGPCAETFHVCRHHHRLKTTPKKVAASVSGVVTERFLRTSKNMSSRILGRTREALRRLRSCARPSEEDASAEELRDQCAENAEVWAERLKGVKLEGLIPERPPRPSAQEITRKHLEAFLKSHRNGDVGSEGIRALLHKVQGKSGEHAAEPSEQEDDAAKSVLATRLAQLYPPEWYADGHLYDWDPEMWDKADVDAVSRALERRDRLGDRSAPIEKGWPALKGSSHTVKPDCGLYKKEQDCIWPCAWKKGKKDQTKMCRPARRS